MWKEAVGAQSEDLSWQSIWMD